MINVRWTVTVTDRAHQDFRGLNKRDQQRIRNFLAQLLEFSSNPRKFGKPYQDKLQDWWEYRVSNHHLICVIQDTNASIVVLRIIPSPTEKG